jgi:hypothetical protein
MVASQGCLFLTVRLPSSSAVPRHDAYPGRWYRVFRFGSDRQAVLSKLLIAIRRYPESEHKQ